MSKSSSQVQTIQVAADPTRVLSLLSKTFTRGTTVLGELLQNARRADASRIDISATDHMIEFVDDGIGIRDFSVLLEVAKSGWNEAIVRAESAYGAGFLATLFCCDRIEVRSRGMMINADTADLIAMKPTPITACDYDSFTVIRLHGPRIKTVHNEPIHAVIAKLCRGFPVPVTFNGALVERPDAMDAQSMLMLDIGRVSEQVVDGAQPSAIYLQGLPIGLTIHSGYNRSTSIIDWNAPPSVIHLDPEQFQGRMPDRDTLIEPEAADKRIKASIKAAGRERLLAIAATMTPEDFVRVHADRAVWLDMRDLLNSIDVVPARWLHTYDDMPTCFDVSVNEDQASPCGDGIVTRAEVERASLLIPNSSNEEGYYDLLAIRYVHAKDAYCWSSAPEWHWLTSMREDLQPEDIRIVPGALRGEDSFDVYDSHAVRVYDGIALQRVDHEGVDIGEPVSVDSAVNWSEGAVYVTPECNVSLAVGMMNDFNLDGDHFLETDRDRAADNLRAARAGILLGEPSDLFRGLILEHGLPTTLPKALRGRTFTVTITEEGVVSVV